MKLTKLILLALAILGSSVFLLIQVHQTYKNALHIVASDEGKQSSQPTVVLDRNGIKLGQFGYLKKNTVNLQNISREFQQSVISAEDRNFYDHHGVSLEGIIRAAWKNLKAGRWLQGASTITQQLIRNRMLTPEKTLSRKLKEVFAAIALENLETKATILERYLNTIYLGNGIYGVESAAQSYFGISADRLAWPESTLLAGMLKAPSRYNPRSKEGFHRAKKRQRYVLNRLIEDGNLSEEEAQSIYETPIEIKPTKNAIGAYPYAMFSVLSFLRLKFANLNLTRDGYTIETTFDESYLRKLDKLNAGLSRVHWFDKQTIKDQNEALLVIDSREGELLALRGGRSFARNQFNRALQMKRPLGGMIMPLIATKALSYGYNLHSDISPGSQSRLANTRGIRIFDALHKRNVYELTQIGVDIGIGTIGSFLMGIGMKSDRPDYDMLWGTKEVSLFDLVRAYQVFSTRGRFRDITLIKKITGPSGEVLFDNAAEKLRVKRVFDESVVFSVNQALLVSQYLTKKQQKALPYSYDSLDVSRQNAWQVIWNSDLVVGIWWGSDSGRFKMSTDLEREKNNFYESYKSIERSMPNLRKETRRSPDRVMYKPLTVAKTNETFFLPQPIRSNKTIIRQVY